MVKQKNAGWEMRSVLVEANPGPPEFLLGARVWVGGRTHPSGWAFVAEIRLTPQLDEEWHEVEGRDKPVVRQCVWKFLVCWEGSGREWGWLSAADLAIEEPQ